MKGKDAGTLAQGSIREESAGEYSNAPSEETSSTKPCRFSVVAKYRVLFTL